MNSIQFRVTILICGIAVALVAVQLVTDTVLQTRETLKAQVATAQSRTEDLAKEITHQTTIVTSEWLRSTTERDSGGFENVSGIQVFSGSGLAIATIGNADFNPKGDVSAFINSDDNQKYINGHASITVVQKLTDFPDKGAYVVAVFKKPSFLAIAGPVVKGNLYSSLPIVLLGVLLASMLARQITLPMKRLAASATEVANGNLDTLVPVGGPNEVNSLGKAVSAMIATLRQNIERIYELAYVDRTTQLPNREYFRNELTRAIRRAIRQESTGALLFVDLDGFKRINDTHGHDVGDILLGQFSDRLANVLRAEDLIGFEAIPKTPLDNEDQDAASDLDDKKKRQVLARLGGDEFTVLLSDIREATDAAIVSKRIIKAVSEPFEINGAKLSIGASIGIAAFPQDGSDYETILKSADMAMYKAKEEGKNTYRFFSSALNEAAMRRSEIEADLRAALKANDQLELYYQPKVDCKSGLPTSAEALIRWKHPEKGMIQPLEFINIAEDCGLILPLGRWILEEACAQIVAFERQGLELSISVNISTAQFERQDLAETVRQVLADTGASPSKLELELTESMAMQNPEAALKHINALKELGVRFAIDDFGTGYSNLSQLSRLPFDVFKIDRSFVDLIDDQEEHGRVIVRTILAMANSLDYATVAEGVETQAQYEFLAENGCTSVQGYLFARPLPSGDFRDWYFSWSKAQQDDCEPPKRIIA